MRPGRMGTPRTFEDAMALVDALQAELDAIEARETETRIPDEQVDKGLAPVQTGENLPEAPALEDGEVGPSEAGSNDSKGAANAATGDKSDDSVGDKHAAPASGKSNVLKTDLAPEAERIADDGRDVKDETFSENKRSDDARRGASGRSRS